MLANVIRSGVVESWHDGALAAVGPDGSILVAVGELDRKFFIRSSAKPFQATICQELGADLHDIALAIACSSHDGDPVHVAHVRQMLDSAGLDENQLQCPPAWPLSAASTRRLAVAGVSRPAAVYNNCSGKHTAMLRACRAQGWPTETYLQPEHPLQTVITEFLRELTGENVEPVGVDGCGAPVHQVTVVGLAGAFRHLACSARLRPALTAMHRYPRLVSGMGNLDAELGIWLNGAAKRGAEGCLGVAVTERFGVGGKAWDGANRAVNVATVEALRRLGVLSSIAPGVLDDFAQPAVLGGGREVGKVVPAFNLAST